MSGRHPSFEIWQHLIVALLLMACSHTASRGHEAKSALREVPCPEDQIALHERARGLYDAEGCGMRVAIRCSAWVCVNLTALARERFEREFSCPAQDIAVSEIAHLIFKVGGCGKSANYACDMRSSQARCAAESAMAP